MTTRHGLFSRAFLLLVLSLGLGLAGCEGSDGAAGTNGADGADGADGTSGQACWDLDNNGVGDLATEDLNGDGVVDVYDCNAYASGAYEIDQLHAGYFTEHPYEGTKSCLNCHGKLADEVLETAHFTWEGLATNIEGHETHYHGKNDILNNFCVAVPTNEGRCTQCHAGYGYKDATYDFGETENIDCLVCHDQTDTYAKAPKTAGLPEDGVDLNFVARSVAENGGRPTIDNCIDCHAKAGGGNNVKHGDLAMSLKNTTRDYDVHMGTDANPQLHCIDCHNVDKDNDGKLLSHGIGGMPFHSVEEGDMQGCDDCHGSAGTIHAGKSVETIVNNHTTLACQVCHIPTFARNEPTKTEWYWEDAGANFDPVPAPDPDTGMPSWDNMKGTFNWENNVRPELRYFNGKWTKALIGESDTYTAEPVVLGGPVGAWDDGASMIYPFKKMIGNQIANLTTQMIMVPHLFGPAGGPNWYWKDFDWDLAVQDASAITGQPYDPATDTLGFVSTEMYLTVNHEVAPKEMAYGMDGDCSDCHFDDKIDWTALGWTTANPGENPDPVIEGIRP